MHNRVDGINKVCECLRHPFEWDGKQRATAKMFGFYFSSFDLLPMVNVRVSALSNGKKTRL